MSDLVLSEEGRTLVGTTPRKFLVHRLDDGVNGEEEEWNPIVVPANVGNDLFFHI